MNQVIQIRKKQNRCALASRWKLDMGNWKLLQPGDWSFLQGLVGEMFAFAAVICFHVLPVFDHKIGGSVAEMPSPSVTVVSTWIFRK